MKNQHDEVCECCEEGECDCVYCEWCEQYVEKLHKDYCKDCEDYIEQREGER